MSRVALVLLFSLAFARAAAAQPVESDVSGDARRAFDAGTLAYDQGHYLDAAVAWEEAHRLTPLPAITFSIAQAYRRQYYASPDPQWLRRARELYARYMTEAPEGPRREHAVTHLATIDALLTRLDAAESATGDGAPHPVTQLMVSARARGARARVDDGAWGSVPHLAEVTPGRHRVSVEARGFFPAAEERVAVAGRLIVAEVTLRARPATVRVSAPGGAKIFVDGAAMGTAPLRHPLTLEAGAHRLAATQRGAGPFVLDLQLDRGESRSVRASLTPTFQRRASTVLLIGAAVTFATGLVTTGLSLAADSDARDLHRPLDRGENLPPGDLPEYEDAVGRRDDFRVASVALFASSLAVGTAGLILWVLDTPEAP